MMGLPRTHWRHLALSLAAALLVFTASFSPAETIVLQGGKELSGAIVHATRNTVAVQREIGGTRQASLAEIREVRITTNTGASVAGSLLAWSDGVYVIRSGNEVIEVRNGQILSVAPAPANQPQMIYVPVANVTPSDASDVEAPGVSKPIVEDPPVETARVAARAAPAEQQPKDSEPRFAITTTVEPALESSPELLFEIKLSRPAEESIVVMYATMDGSAQSGADYEPRQGAVIIESGASVAKVGTPLIDDDLTEGDEEVLLFLTVDPSVARLADDKVVATIKDDD